MPPAAPQRCQRQRRATALVTLAWTANGEADLAGYNVYRSTHEPGADQRALRSTARRLLTQRDLHRSARSRTARPITTSSQPSMTPANVSPASTEAVCHAGAVTPAPALEFNGTNQYVTFGSAAALGAQRRSRSRPGSSARARASARTPARGGITRRDPAGHQGPRREPRARNIDMNYFLGIDAATGVLVADFEDTATRRPEPSGHSASRPSPSAPRLAPRGRRPTTATTWRLYLDGVLEIAAPWRQSHAALRQHPARRARHRDNVDRRRSGLLRRDPSTRFGSGTSRARRPRSRRRCTRSCRRLPDSSAAGA